MTRFNISLALLSLTNLLALLTILEKSIQVVTSRRTAKATTPNTIGASASVSVSSLRGESKSFPHHESLVQVVTVDGSSRLLTQTINILGGPDPQGWKNSTNVDD